MTALSAFVRLLCTLPLAVVLSGCFLPNEGAGDEEKDPHYLVGKNRATSLDYDGAIIAFENALASNPKNAAAHLELGLLYEERKNNYGSAIYHFERHLEFRPESNMAETVKQHIMACKLELAKSVSFLLVNRQVQDELRRLYTTNSWLLEQNGQLRNLLRDQASAFSNRLAQVTQAAAQSEAAARERRQTAQQTVSYSDPDTSSSYYSDRSPTPAPPATRSSSSRSTPVVSSGSSHSPTTVARTPPASSGSSYSATTIPRTHLVKVGETMASIANKYNLKLNSLLAMNPSVDSRHLKAGTILNLPGAKY